MGVAITSFTAKKELNQGEKVFEIDFGSGQRFAFGFAKFNGNIHPTKQIVYLNQGQLDWAGIGVTLDATPKVVGLEFFNSYKTAMINANPAVANSYFAAITPGVISPNGNIGGVTLAAAGLVSTDAIGLFTDGAGIITRSAPVELTFDEKLEKAITSTSAASSTTASSTLSDFVKKPLNWVYVISGIVLAYLGFKALDKKKK